jgi:hypothetical protein
MRLCLHRGHGKWWVERSGQVDVVVPVGSRLFAIHLARFGRTVTLGRVAGSIAGEVDPERSTGLLFSPLVQSRYGALAENSVR